LGRRETALPIRERLRESESVEKEYSPGKDMMEEYL
jgi:hypothetical protein